MLRGQFAYTLCGIRQLGQEWQLLVFDPHLVAGPELQPEGLTVQMFEDGRAFALKSSSPPQEPGAARWIPLESFFDRARWMFCLPIPDQMLESRDALDFDSFTFELNSTGRVWKPSPLDHILKLAIESKAPSTCIRVKRLMERTFSGMTPLNMFQLPSS